MLTLAAAVGIAGCEKVEAPQSNLVTLEDSGPAGANQLQPAASTGEFNVATGFTGDYNPYAQRGGTPPPPPPNAPKWPEPQDHAVVEPGEVPRD